MRWQASQVYISHWLSMVSILSPATPSVQEYVAGQRAMIAPRWEKLGTAVVPPMETIKVAAYRPFAVRECGHRDEAAWTRHIPGHFGVALISSLLGNAVGSNILVRCYCSIERSIMYELGLPLTQCSR